MSINLFNRPIDETKKLKQSVVSSKTKPGLVIDKTTRLILISLGILLVAFVLFLFSRRSTTPTSSGPDLKSLAQRYANLQTITQEYGNKVTDDFRSNLAIINTTLINDLGQVESMRVKLNSSSTTPTSSTTVSTVPVVGVKSTSITNTLEAAERANQLSSVLRSTLLTENQKIAIDLNNLTTTKPEVTILINDLKQDNLKINKLLQ